MRLLFPAGLFILALIPILILIHSLKPKPGRANISTLFLWREILDEDQGGVRIRQLLKNLPLLLQILIIIIAAITLSRPVINYSPEVSGNHIVVIDTSASMKTRSGETQRFETAKTKALELINASSPKSEMMVIEASASPRIRSDFTSDKQLLRRTVDELVATDISGNLEKTVLFALSFLRTGDVDNSIMLITDGAGMDLDRLLALHPAITPILVEGGDRNIGITAFEFREYPEQNGVFEIMLELKNYLPSPALIPIEISIDETLIDTRVIGLGSGEKKAVFFPYRGILEGQAKARLVVDDDFLTDNEAHVVLNSTNDIWIQLVSKGNVFLEKLLAIYPHFQVNTMEEVDTSSWDDQLKNNDIVIVDGVPVPPATTGNLLLINTLTPSLPLVRSGETQHPIIVTVQKDHPILQNLELSHLRIEKAMHLTATDGTRPLVETRQAGLIFAHEKDGLKAVTIGFDISRSDLPFKVAYPVLMSNIFQWLRPDGVRFSPTNSKTGDVISASFSSSGSTIMVRTPEGQRLEFESTEKTVTFEDTQTVGIYRLSKGRDRHYFAVNLTNERESDIRIPIIKTREETVIDQPSYTPVFSEFHLWLFFALTLPLLLTLEMVFWFKQK